MDDCNLEGLWWLPGDEKKVFGGILSFSNTDGLELKLFGAFKELPDIGSTSEYELIFGLANGKQITLFDCMESGTRLTVPGMLTQRFWARAGCIGRHLAPLAQQRFHKVNVQYSHLAEWTQSSGFETDWKTSKDDLKEYHLKFSYPAEVQANTDAGKISISYGFEYRPNAISEITLRQSVHFRVEPTEALTFDAMLNQFVRPLQNLLTLATRKANSVTGVSMFPVHEDVAASEGVRDSPIEFLYQQSFRPDSQPEKTLTPYDMLFSLPDINDRFNHTIQSWFRVADELDSVCSLFFGLRYASRVYSEWEFLNLAQAAESYHRRRFKSRVLSDKEHRTRTKAILQSVPEEHRSWLKDKLTHSNEPTLRERLRELISSTSHIVGPLLQDKEDFIKKVADTRNYLTHYDPRLRKKMPEARQLYTLQLVLTFVIETLLLNELGFSLERSAELFQRNQQYTYAVTQARRSNS